MRSLSLTSEWREESVLATNAVWPLSAAQNTYMTPINTSSAVLALVGAAAGRGASPDRKSDSPSTNYSWSKNSFIVAWWLLVLRRLLLALPLLLCAKSPVTLLDGVTLIMISPSKRLWLQLTDEVQNLHIKHSNNIVTRHLMLYTNLCFLSQILNRNPAAFDA